MTIFHSVSDTCNWWKQDQTYSRSTHSQRSSRSLLSSWASLALFTRRTRGSLRTSTTLYRKQAKKGSEQGDSARAQTACFIKYVEMLEIVFTHRLTLDTRISLHSNGSRVTLSSKTVQSLDCFSVPLMRCTNQKFIVKNSWMNKA